MAKERPRRFSATEIETQIPDAPSQTTRPETDRTRQIATLAHQLWVERGCPCGTPDEDWFRAEKQLQAGSAKVKLSARA
jgi:hypothetical protein